MKLYNFDGSGVCFVTIGVEIVTVYGNYFPQKILYHEEILVSFVNNKQTVNKIAE